MDNFMSKLSQKMNAQDMIKANFMADAAEKEQMKKQLAEYESIIQSVHSLCRKQEANNAVLQQLLNKLEEAAAREQIQPALLQDIKECIAKSDEFTHRESVKVYRNVQALLEEQDKKLEAGLDTLKQQTEAGIHALQQQATSGVNTLKQQIEAAKAPDLTEELAEMKRLVKRHNRGTKALLWLVLLASFVNVAAVLLIHFGLF